MSDQMCERWSGRFEERGALALGAEAVDLGFEYNGRLESPGLVVGMCVYEETSSSSWTRGFVDGGKKTVNLNNLVRLRCTTLPNLNLPQIKLNKNGL
jgi:hypothetical protein